MSFVYKRHTKWRIFLRVEKRDVVLSVDKTFVVIGLVVPWKRPKKFKSLNRHVYPRIFQKNSLVGYLSVVLPNI